MVLYGIALILKINLGKLTSLQYLLFLSRNIISISITANLILHFSIKCYFLHLSLIHFYYGLLIDIWYFIIIIMAFFIIFSICSYYRKVNWFVHIYPQYGHLTEVSYSNSFSINFLGIFSKKKKYIYTLLRKKDVISLLITMNFERQYIIWFKVKDSWVKPPECLFSYTIY